jgi:D-alanyl-D-alanine carboxypeptidase
MLLPSGNDAAMVIADYFGGVIATKMQGAIPPKSF